MNRLRGSKAESTVSSYHYQLKHFVEWCEDKRIASISEVDGWDIDSFENHRREQGIALLSLSKELQTLKLFLEYCARVELVDEGLPGRLSRRMSPERCTLTRRGSEPKTLGHY